jgi:thiol-disulfide isomerase/thioredoxin
MRPLRALALVLVFVTTVHAGAVRVGDEAPAVVADVSLAALRGKVVCVDFWASWCTVCRATLPALDEIARHSPGLEVLAVNVDKERSAADRFLAALLPAPALRVVYDPGGDVMARFGAAGMPSLYVIDRRGIVRAVVTDDDGGRLREVVERHVNRLLAEPVP